MSSNSRSHSIQDNQSSPQASSDKPYASATSDNSVPKIDQAIILNSIDGVSNDDYLDECVSSNVEGLAENPHNMDGSEARNNVNHILEVNSNNCEIQGKTSSDASLIFEKDTTGCDKDATQCGSSRIEEREENSTKIDGSEARNNVSYNIDSKNCPLTTNETQGTRIVDDTISRSEEIRGETSEISAQTATGPVDRITIPLQSVSNITFNVSTSGNDTVIEIDIKRYPQ